MQVSAVRRLLAPFVISACSASFLAVSSEVVSNLFNRFSVKILLDRCSPVHVGFDDLQASFDGINVAEPHLSSVPQAVFLLAFGDTRPRDLGSFFQGS